MQKQKRGFWLFIFSLIPGAGEMYMGFKKQGISIMLLFWSVIAIAAWSGMNWFIFLIPIIWFYSFFNVHNLKCLSEEEFYSMEDTYILHMDRLGNDIDTLIFGHRKSVAIFLIVFGAAILWNNIVDFFYFILPSRLANILGTFAYHLPQIVIAIAIILTGWYLLTRKKDELSEIQTDEEEEHYWMPYRPYQQETASESNIADTASPADPDTPAATESSHSSTSSNESTTSSGPISLKKTQAENLPASDEAEHL